MKKYRIGIVGATGAVGQEIIKLLEKREFPASELRLLASSRSAGNELEALGQTHKIQETTPESFKDLDIAIFSAGSENSVKFAHEAVKRGCVAIDNSSAFRMDPSVPLVVPEINPQDLDTHQGIVANPNCSSAITLMAIYPLHKRFGLKKFYASTYQAVSGAGAIGPISLDQEVTEMVTGAPPPNAQPSAFPHPIAFNLIPHVDQFREDGYTKEELKMRNESRKILSLPSLRVSCTCVRVPVYRAHSISINAEFSDSVNLPDAKQALSNFNGLEFVDNPEDMLYPMPIYSSEKENCHVGRLRVDHAADNGLALWVTGDQLWKGAALNAIQIAEEMILRNCLRKII
ncbi:aspartate-semialdehyde dehydrogenase [Candidatus Chordibacter forsetii]|uniref:aspartate-semialdehyde dehydrogenase n=1 Tax=Candidatus Chordibacter forsetii TaxID=3381758 RepID=UPI00389ACD2B